MMLSFPDESLLKPRCIDIGPRTSDLHPIGSVGPLPQPCPTAFAKLSEALLPEHEPRRASNPHPIGPAPAAHAPCLFATCSLAASPYRCRIFIQPASLLDRLWIIAQKPLKLFFKLLRFRLAQPEKIRFVSTAALILEVCWSTISLIPQSDPRRDFCTLSVDNSLRVFCNIDFAVAAKVFWNPCEIGHLAYCHGHLLLARHSSQLPA
jgi:hypothetical protein